MNQESNIDYGDRELSLEEYQKAYDYLIDFLEKCDNSLKFPKLEFNIANRVRIEEDNMNRTSLCFTLKDVNMRIKYLNYRRCVDKLNKITQLNTHIRDKIIANIIRFEYEIYELFKNKEIQSDQLIDLFDKYDLSNRDIEFHIRIGTYAYTTIFTIWINFLNKHSKKLIYRSYNNDDRKSVEKFTIFTKLRDNYTRFFSEGNFSFKYDRDIDTDMD